MTAYVRVSKWEQLVEAIDLTGTQVDVAAAAGLSIQRVNQLYVGSHNVLEVRKARQLESVLGAPLGSLFIAVDGPLLLPYVHEDDPGEPGEPTSVPAPEQPPAEPMAPAGHMAAALAREAEEIERAEFSASLPAA